VNTQRLRAEALEQLMRMTSDEALVARLSTTTSPATALGRLPADIFKDLVPGCPLLALQHSGPPIAPSWRSHYKPVKGSLYATLLFLRSLDSRDLGDINAYQELINRRQILEGDTSGPMLEP
jgi:hypothetical protein